MKLASAKNFYIKSSLFTILSLAAAACSYILYPILVRALPASDFGDFAVASALLNQVLAILMAINIISIHLVKTYSTSEARHYAQVIQKTLLWFFIIVCSVIIILSPLLQGIFKISNLALFLPLAAVLLASVPLTVWNGFLQGHKELIRIGVASAGSAFAKLMFASLLGLLVGSVGALFGIFIGSLVGIVILYLYPGVKLPSLKATFRRSTRADRHFLHQHKFYIAQAAIVVGLLGVLQGYDVTLAKALFTPDVAGLYGAIGVLSYVLYYLAFILIWITLPEIDIRKPQINRRVLGTAYRLIGFLATTAIIIELFFGSALLSLVLGNGYADKYSWLLVATLYQLTLVAVALYAFYLIICHKSRVLLLVGYIASCCFLLPLLIATSPQSMIVSLWFASILGITLYLATIGIYRLMRRAT